MGEGLSHHPLPSLQAPDAPPIPVLLKLITLLEIQGIDVRTLS